MKYGHNTQNCNFKKQTQQDTERPTTENTKKEHGVQVHQEPNITKPHILKITKTQQN